MGGVLAQEHMVLGEESQRDFKSSTASSQRPALSQAAREALKASASFNLRCSIESKKHLSSQSCFFTALESRVAMPRAKGSDSWLH